MRLRAIAQLIAVSMLVAPCVDAQRKPIIADSSLLPIAASRLDVEDAPMLRGARAVIVPTALVYLAMEGSLRASSQTTRSAATVTIAYQVTGIEKSIISEVARLAATDLADRLRRRGLTVLEYDSVKSHPTMSRVEHLTTDATFGAPVLADASHTIYAIVAPSDAQTLGAAHAKSVEAFKAMARELNAVVVVPEIWFDAPHLERQQNFTPGSVAAGVTVSQGMDARIASLSIITPTGSVGLVRLRQPLLDLSDIVGTVMPLGTDSARLGGGRRQDQRMLADAGLLGAGRARLAPANGLSKSNVEFIVFPQAYSRAILRGAASFFQAVAEAIPRK